MKKMKKRLFIIISISLLVTLLLATLIFFAVKKYTIGESYSLFENDSYVENLKEEEKEIEVEFNGTKNKLKYYQTFVGWQYRTVRREYLNDSKTADGYVRGCKVDAYTGKIIAVDYTFPANYEENIENRKISAEERKKIAVDFFKSIGVDASLYSLTEKCYDDDIRHFPYYHYTLSKKIKTDYYADELSVSGAFISVSVTEAGDIKAYFIGGRDLLEGKLNFIMPSASTMKRMNEDLTDRALKNIDRRKQVDKEYNYGTRTYTYEISDPVIVRLKNGRYAFVYSVTVYMGTMCVDKIRYAMMFYY